MLVDIDKIKVNDRIRKDLGNLSELAEDIEKNGLINPPVVTPDYELIAGERRLEAMRQLGYKQVEVRTFVPEDAEHKLMIEISENEERKEFTKTERIDYARKLERIERVKASQRGKAGVAIDPSQNFGQGRSEDIVAEKLGIGSGEQYRKEKYIADNANEEILKAWNDEKISTHKAYQRVKELEKKLADKEEINKQLTDQISQMENQVEVIEKEVIPEDYRDLKNEVDGLLEYQRDLENKLYEEQKNAKEVIKEVKPKDYDDLKSKIKKLQGDNDKLRDAIAKERSIKKDALQQLEGQKQKEEIIKEINSFAWTINGFIKDVGGLIYLTDYIDEVPQSSKKLFISSAETLEKWAGQLIYNINSKKIGANK